MRYIKKLHLENFQSYKNETILFEPGLNLLLGTSDSGKSAILRAISFVFHNFPRGSTLIHDGANETRVTIEFSDGVVVTRIKGERNAYLAKTKDGKNIAFDKIDKSIPDEILALLNNPPVDEFNGMISYADQFAPMFLVDLSPSELPRSLSNLTGIEVLEECAKQLMQNYKSIEKQIKSSEKSYLDLINEFHSYDIVDDCAIELDKCQEKYLRFEQLCQDYEKLKVFELLSDYHTLTENLNILNSVLISCEKLETMLLDFDSKLKKFDKLNIFNIAIDSKNLPYLATINKIVQDCEYTLDKIKHIHFVFNQYKECCEINDEYEHIKSHGQKNNNEYKILQESLKKAVNDLEDYKQYLVDNNISCSVCGSVII